MTSDATWSQEEWRGFASTLRNGYHFRMDQTAENIRLLAVFHYVLGGLTYFLALFPIFHFAIGLFLLLAPFEEWAEPPAEPPSESIRVEETTQTDPSLSDDPYDRNDTSPQTDLRPEDVWIVRGMGGIFTGVAAVIMLSGFVLATLMIIAGRRLSKHRSHTFCLILAGLECMLFPFHSILGIFTFILLLRPEGRALFNPPVASPEQA